MSIHISDTRQIHQTDIIALYESLQWSSADKPELLYQALMNSHSLITAWDGDKLVGLGNAISDGYLVVYYPHLLIHPAYQRHGIGRMIVDKMQQRYADFHQQCLIADGQAVDFYQKVGFETAGSTQPLWIYQGNEH